MHEQDPTGSPEPFVILPAQYVGRAGHGPDGKLRIGEGDHVVEIDLSRTGVRPDGYCCWWYTHTVSVYVRRNSIDLSVTEIHMARHDGLAQEALDAQNDEAARYPLGPKEYWRAEMVGKYTMGSDGRFMSDEDFENEWGDDVEWGDDD